MYAWHSDRISLISCLQRVGVEGFEPRLSPWRELPNVTEQAFGLSLISINYCVCEQAEVNSVSVYTILMFYA